MRSFFHSIAVIILVIYYHSVTGNQNPTVSISIAQKQIFTLPDYYKKYTLSFGNSEAPIQIYKFFSFACPSCLMFYKHHFPIIQSQFIDTNQVYWTFVPYVMDIDTLYIMAATSPCTDEEKLKIFELIMEKASSWTEGDNKEQIIQTLKACGISDDIIQTNLSEANYEAVLQESLDFQECVIIDGTPTLFINGTEIPGIPSAEKLSKIITDMLNNQQGDFK
ncbi:MAG: thioredoxin domain-containing protein [Candidatus Paracaedibacteraceae bacterium]|nr:thioredoxin domain-containing protein [Candidatus Paracaedibacteraceae bacterium]